MFQDHKPYLITASYAILCAAAVILVFREPPPRFMDLFLIGIAFACARWSWRQAAFLFLCSLVIAAWALPPRNSFSVANPFDQYRMYSYSITASAVILAVDYARRERGP